MSGVARKCTELRDTRILLLTSLREGTGNAVTAARLAELIPAAHCFLLDINALPDAEALRKHVCECHVGLVLGIHAYRAGRLLVGCGVPFAIVLGGTDMNVMLHDEPKRLVMLDALAQAGAIIAFNQELLGRLLEAMPEARPKTFLVPQAVRTSLVRLDAEGGDLDTVGGLGAGEAHELRRRLELEADDVLLLLPAGLRPVKDVLFGAREVAAWHAREPRLCLRIVGPELDSAYAAQVRAALQELGSPRGVAYVGALPQHELHAAMRQARLVLNTSTSEGMCNSLLEAMLVGTPVLARANPGNAALLGHDGTMGLLFETADELVQRAEVLLADTALGARLAQAAAEHVTQHHSAQAETEGYRAALQLALDLPKVMVDTRGGHS